MNNNNTAGEGKQRSLNEQINEFEQDVHDAFHATPSPERLTAEGKGLSDFMTGKEMSDMILLQTKEIYEASKEIVSVRSYLLDNYGPFSKCKILTGDEETVDMVKTVIARLKST